MVILPATASPEFLPPACLVVAGIIGKNFIKRIPPGTTEPVLPYLAYQIMIAVINHVNIPVVVPPSMADRIPFPPLNAVVNRDYGILPR